MGRGTGVKGEISSWVDRNTRKSIYKGQIEIDFAKDKSKRNVIEMPMKYVNFINQHEGKIHVNEDANFVGGMDRFLWSR